MGQGFESLQARQGHGGYSSAVERQNVALDVVGSSPTTHPIFPFLGVSPSGKARDFDSRTVGSNPATPAKDLLRTDVRRWRSADIRFLHVAGGLPACKAHVFL